MNKSILTHQERVQLRALFDFDKEGVLDKFLSKYQDIILRSPSIQSSEWDFLRTTLAKESQAILIDDIKEQFNLEISDIEVENG